MTESPETHEHPETNGQTDISSIHARIKIFENPFAYQVLNTKVELYCSHCMRPPKTGEKLMKCAGCDFIRYCSKDCQRLAWKVHRPECRRLKAVFPNLPLTEVLFLSKVIDRVVFLEQYGDKFNWERERKFSSLMDHKEDIRKTALPPVNADPGSHPTTGMNREDTPKMEHFEKVYLKMEAFRKDEMVSKDQFFDVFCKTSINSHSIHTNAGDEIGMSLDLGVSKYNHSCRPTCSMVFDGYRVCLRPLVPGIDADNLEQAFISYIDVGRSKFIRRRELRGKWYFDCQCTRCSDPQDDILTSIKCATKDCDQALIVTEDEEPCTIGCNKCGKLTDESRIKAAQELMRSLPVSFNPNTPADTLRDYLQRAELILHPNNVYIARLQTALFHITGELTMANLSTMHKQIYENYKLCFPKADRHVGYQLLHIVKALIEKGQRSEAMPYAFDAMNIFEVCFGLDHPYYLQTLALWTYLEKRLPKTDEELIGLTNFSDNRPVDIVTLLEKANMLPSQPSLTAH